MRADRQKHSRADRNTSHPERGRNKQLLIWRIIGGSKRRSSKWTNSQRCI